MSIVAPCNATCDETTGGLVSTTRLSGGELALPIYDEETWAEVIDNGTKVGQMPSDSWDHNHRALDQDSSGEVAPGALVIDTIHPK